ncbi:MAG: adenylate/guanylate cyclase domain-containing protein [Saprospiraceae bacterium]|nr:adenylate/guanylate cyclase domain-containing protein [Saprospiraceae bacterium]
MELLINHFIRFAGKVGVGINDTEDVRIRKQTLTMISVLISAAGLVWGSMYAALGLPVTAMFPYAYSLLMGLAIIIFHNTKNFSLLLNTELVLILLLPFFVQWSIGGFAASGVVMLWAILSPMGALLFRGIRHAIFWFSVYIFLTVASIYFEQFLDLPRPTISSPINLIFFVMNIATVSVITFSSVLHFVSEQKKIKQRNEEYLVITQQNQEEIEKKNRQLERLSNQLSKYLSPQVYRSVFLGKEVRHETYRKKLTVFFSDIKEFTDITDSMESESLANLLNNYLNEMARIALQYGGTIDKFMGDAIMVFFGDPESKGDKEDALNCVLMAIEMRSRMEELRQEWINDGYPHALHIRMGINTGYCTVGNFGSEDRMDYTIIGGQVNIASRLEALSEPDQILISHETYSLVKDRVVCQPLGEITVRGVRYPVKTYSVVGLQDLSSGGDGHIRLREKGMVVDVDMNTIDPDQALQYLRALIGNMESKIQEPEQGD